MRSRFLLELTTPEVEAYLAEGGTTALLPVGCVEMHGPHQPIGTDSIVAKAFALRIAQAANGIVLPTIHYTWPGSTQRGSKSMRCTMRRLRLRRGVG